jgi:hypothetical protein
VIASAVAGVLVALACASSAVTPAGAQQAPTATPSAPPSAAALERTRLTGVDARYKVRVMEGVLEKSVEHAALRLNEQLQRVSPDLIQLAGAAHARGYRLEGYGLFFDVEVPAAMRQTMGWTARVMRQQQQGLNEALGSLKRITGDLDPKSRAEAERAMQQLELVVRPMPRRGGPGGIAMPAASTNGEPSPVPPPGAAPDASVDPIWRNPDMAYEEQVREALIGAMLEWGALLPVGSDEWLTVAARDNQDVIMPGNAPDVVTIILRVKGSDLADRVAGRVPLDELRRRVEVTEF